MQYIPQLPIYWRHIIQFGFGSQNNLLSSLHNHCIILQLVMALCMKTPHGVLCHSGVYPRWVHVSNEMPVFNIQNVKRFMKICYVFIYSVKLFSYVHFFACCIWIHISTQLTPLIFFKYSSTMNHVARYQYVDMKIYCWTNIFIGTDRIQDGYCNPCTVGTTPQDKFTLQYILSIW